MSFLCCHEMSQHKHNISSDVVVFNIIHLQGQVSVMVAGLKYDWNINYSMGNLDFPEQGPDPLASRFYLMKALGLCVICLLCLVNVGGDIRRVYCADIKTLLTQPPATSHQP